MFFEWSAGHIFVQVAVIKLKFNWLDPRIKRYVIPNAPVRGLLCR